MVAWKGWIKGQARSGSQFDAQHPLHRQLLQQCRVPLRPRTVRPRDTTWLCLSPAGIERASRTSPRRQPWQMVAPKPPRLAYSEGFTPLQPRRMRAVAENEDKFAKGWHEYFQHS